MASPIRRFRPVPDWLTYDDRFLALDLNTSGLLLRMYLFCDFYGCVAGGEHGFARDMGLSYPRATVEGRLNELREVGFVKEYSIDGQLILELVDYDSMLTKNQLERRGRPRFALREPSRYRGRTKEVVQTRSRLSPDRVETKSRPSPPLQGQGQGQEEGESACARTSTTAAAADAGSPTSTTEGGDASGATSGSGSSSPSASSPQPPSSLVEDFEAEVGVLLTEAAMAWCAKLADVRSNWRGDPRDGPTLTEIGPPEAQLAQYYDELLDLARKFGGRFKLAAEGLASAWSCKIVRSRAPLSYLRRRCTMTMPEGVSSTKTRPDGWPVIEGLQNHHEVPQHVKEKLTEMGLAPL